MTNAACKNETANATKMTVREVGGWPLAFRDGDEEPRILDVELAQRLGYSRPEECRKLIRRMIASGKLNASEVFATLAETTARGGRPGKEFWLTEAQALKVAAKSETEPADALLDEMIHVFRLAVRGMLSPQVPAIQPANDALWNIVTDLHMQMQAERAETKALREQVTALALNAGTITGEQADWITGQIEVLANLRHLLGYNPSMRSAKARVHQDLCAAVKWGGTGALRRHMPASKMPDVRVFFDTMTRMLNEEAARRRKGSAALSVEVLKTALQGQLFAAPANDPARHAN